MVDATVSVVERPINEVIVEGDDDVGPSNDVSPRQQDDCDTSQVPNLIPPQSNEEEIMDNEGGLIRRPPSNMAIQHTR